MMVWGLVQRLGGQVRMVAGFGGAAALGWDMTAALALGAAMGLSPWLLSEMLPPIEAAAIRAMNREMETGRG